MLFASVAEALYRVPFHNDLGAYPTYTTAEMMESRNHPAAKTGAQTDNGIADSDAGAGPDTPTSDSPTASPPADPHEDSPPSKLSRNPSCSGSSTYQEDWDIFPPLDRQTVLDLLDNFALPQQLEKLQRGISAQTEKVRKSREVFRSKGNLAKERVVEEWRRRVPSAEEQLERYRSRMKKSVERLGVQWNDTKVITLREKVAFICGVMNIFISGYLIGAFPEHFYLWYTVQLLHFLPIRFFTYHSRGYHYFLADLCYFVNVLLLLSMWIFPSSKRLFLATYCLAFGNNAVAIIMWRNSLVFHSFDKVTSLFIHIMPCATLHCIVHLLSPEQQRELFPAVYNIQNPPPGSPKTYGNLVSMLAWSTIPYAIWQLTYYFFITVRRRDKIAAGRPTSYTWLRRSYSKVWIGKIVLALPDILQEPAFMLIQYMYAVLTMLPCPLWFCSRWASSLFLMGVFAWSVYNGSTFYIDVFGRRFQKELETMKAEVAKWQSSPDLMLQSPLMTPMPDAHGQKPGAAQDAAGAMGTQGKKNVKGGSTQLVDPATGRSLSLDKIPLLNDERNPRNTTVDPRANTAASGFYLDEGAREVATERKPVVGGPE